MLINKIKTYIGFAIKSNNVIFGVDNIIVKRYSPKLVLYDLTLAEGSLKKLTEYCSKRTVEMVAMDSLNELTFRENTKAIGIKDKNLASAILMAIKESV